MEKLRASFIVCCAPAVWNFFFYKVLFLKRWLHRACQPIDILIYVYNCIYVHINEVPLNVNDTNSSLLDALARYVEYISPKKNKLLKTLPMPPPATPSLPSYWDGWGGPIKKFCRPSVQVFPRGFLRTWFPSFGGVIHYLYIALGIGGGVCTDGCTVFVHCTLYT